jgi:hypothetical protein
MQTSHASWSSLSSSVDLLFSKRDNSIAFISDTKGLEKRRNTEKKTGHMKKLLESTTRKAEKEIGNNMQRTLREIGYWNGKWMQLTRDRDQ